MQLSLYQSLVDLTCSFHGVCHLRMYATVHFHHHILSIFFKQEPRHHSFIKKVGYHAKYLFLVYCIIRLPYAFKMRQDYLSTSYLDQKYLPSERSETREI